MSEGIVRRSVGLGFLGALFARLGAAQPNWAVPDDAAIHRILAERIDVQRQGVGLVVGVVDAAGRRVVSHGVRAKGDARALDGDTVFEIGSITKVFTALLLSDMVARGEAALDEPVAALLPPEVRVPERGGKAITLIDLATHTSALPGLPTNFAPKDALNPYADYTVDQLHTFLGEYALIRDIGSRYEYSNLGAGLLGHALSRRAGQSYEALVATRITRPLGLKDTVITLSPAQRTRMAQGHDASGQPTPNWDLPTLAGAGALRSTANDMLTFLAAEMGLTATPLRSAMDAQLVPRRPAGGPMAIALGWHVIKAGGREVVWHNGGTGGYRSFIGFDPKTRVGVVVLANLANEVGGDDIGSHLLAGRPLAKLGPPPPVRVAVTLPSEQLAGLVGRYTFGPMGAMTITQEGGHLFAQLTGQPVAEVFAESPTRFFWRIVDAQLTFVIGPDGRASDLILHQAGRDQRAKRADP